MYEELKEQLDLKPTKYEPPVLDTPNPEALRTILMGFTAGTGLRTAAPQSTSQVIPPTPPPTKPEEKSIPTTMGMTSSTPPTSFPQLSIKQQGMNISSNIPSNLIQTSKPQFALTPQEASKLPGSKIQMVHQSMNPVGGPTPTSLAHHTATPTPIMQPQQSRSQILGGPIRQNTPSVGNAPRGLVAPQYGGIIGSSSGSVQRVTTSAPQPIATQQQQLQYPAHLATNQATKQQQMYFMMSQKPQQQQQPPSQGRMQ